MIIDYSKYSDIELLRLISQKHKDSNRAFSEFYDRHQVHVRTYCRYLLDRQSDIEDVFQETFVAFYKNIISSSAIPDNPKGYLIRIARNQCLKSNRDLKIGISIDGLDILDNELNNYDNNELLEIISKSLLLIDEKLREVFILKEFNGLSHSEIANILEISVQNSKVRLFRAHKELTTILQPYIRDLAGHNG